jgi:calpain-15
MAAFKEAVYPKISTCVPEHMKTDQEPRIIRECQQRGIKFSDPEFKPCWESMVGNPPSAEHAQSWRQLKWARADDILGSGQYEVFRDIEPNDIHQGEIGDCYFLSALSSLAEHPDLIKRLFDTQEVNQSGVYAVWLNIDGMWREFILDDYFPVRQTERGVSFAFTKTSEEELWPMLLEKAYAKAYGNYDKIVGGDPVYALRDLTGAPFKRIESLS